MSTGITTRVVRRLRLVSARPGKWALESAPDEIVFQRQPRARIGAKRHRQTVEPWEFPGSDVQPPAYTLDAAVREYLAATREPRRQVTIAVGSDMGDRRLLCLRCAMAGNLDLRACERCGTLCCEHKYVLRAAAPDGQLSVVCAGCARRRR